MRPIRIPEYILRHFKTDGEHLSEIDQIKQRVGKLGAGVPLVSVVIPAYNEQDNILRTIASLSCTEAAFPVEIVIVDNNSTDGTRERIERSGARYILEEKKGVENARSTGLREARGTYIISGDADTIYSPYWVELMTRSLRKNEGVGLCYGKFAFLPEGGENRLAVYGYEIIGDIYKRINGWMKDRAMYVYGVSSAFRKEQGVAVGGYAHPEGTNEDGYMGIKLRAKFGKMKQIRSKHAYAWTSNRKLLLDGNLFSRLMKKIKKTFSGG